MFDTKILAIDYGTKRIGLAVNYLTLAEPYGIIQKTDETLIKLTQIIAKEGIELIVVGVSEQAMAEQSRQFAAEVAQATRLPVEFADETLTSKVVAEKLRDGGAKLSTRLGPIDHYAAAEFLQEWLDSHE